MTRANILAKILFDASVKLKTLDYNILNRGASRKEFISSLTAIQLLVGCVGMSRFTDEQAEALAKTLKTTYRIKADLAELKAADEHSDFSEKHQDLIFKMNTIVSKCIKDTVEHKNGYMAKVNRLVLAFHNLPRAFLDSADGLSLSPEDAWSYSSAYFEI
jgi:hypothetical protein